MVIVARDTEKFLKRFRSDIKHISKNNIAKELDKLDGYPAEEYHYYEWEQLHFRNLLDSHLPRILKEGVLKTSSDEYKEIVRRISTIKNLTERKWGLYVRFLRVEKYLQSSVIEHFRDLQKSAKSLYTDLAVGNVGDAPKLRRTLQQMKVMYKNIVAARKDFYLMRNEAGGPKKDLSVQLYETYHINDEQLRQIKALRKVIIQTIPKNVHPEIVHHTIDELNQIIRILKVEHGNLKQLSNRTKKIIKHIIALEKDADKIQEEVRLYAPYLRKRA